jgi:N-acetyl-gamma-glutamyl-phosphate reductase
MILAKPRDCLRQQVRDRASRGAKPHASGQPQYLPTDVVQRRLDLEQTKAMAYLDPQALNGTNDLQLGVFANAGHGQVLLSAVFDNLGKGASGAAVQNIELMLSVGLKRAD